MLDAFLIEARIGWMRGILVCDNQTSDLADLACCTLFIIDLLNIIVVQSTG